MQAVASAKMRQLHQSSRVAISGVPTSTAVEEACKPVSYMKPPCSDEKVSNMDGLSKVRRKRVPNLHIIRSFKVVVMLLGGSIIIPRYIRQTKPEVM